MEKLIIDAQQGNEEAYSTLMKEIGRDLFNIAKLKIKNKEDVNDVLQNTSFAIYKNLPKLREPKFFKTWCIKILTNECKKLYEKQAKEFSLIEKLITNFYPGESSMTDFYNALSDLDFNDMLVKTLTPEESEILAMHYSLGIPLVEISRMKNLNVNTVKSKFHRAKLKVIDYYKSEEGGHLYEEFSTK